MASQADEPTENPTAVVAVLAAARKRLGNHSPTPRLDAEVLLAHLLDRDRSWFYAHQDDSLPATTLAQYEQLLERRVQQVPVAYLTGRQEFWSLEFTVGDSVLVPRPDTELLVETGIELVQDLEAPRILDMGIGSGAVAIALACELRHADITGSDSCSKALDIATTNANRLQPGRIRLLQSNWFDNLGDEVFDLIVSNPPYIADDDAHLYNTSIRHEPRMALVSGLDGLDAIRHICNHAHRHLHPNGALALEHGYNQGAAVRSLLHQHGYVAVETRRDTGGNDRVSSGRRSGIVE